MSLSPSSQTIERGEKNSSHKNSSRHRRSSGSQSSLLSEENDPAESATSAAATTGSATCIVSELAFKIPAGYKCTNYYLPTGIDPSLIEGHGQTGRATASDHRRATHYGQQPIEEDDILLQLAIQQSLSEAGDTNAQLTALGMLAGQLHPRYAIILTELCKILLFNFLLR